MKTAESLAAEHGVAEKTVRRAGTVAAAADVIGQVYNERKRVHGGDRKSSTQNEDLIERTCVAVAAELGIGRATVQRSGWEIPKAGAPPKKISTKRGKL